MDTCRAYQIVQKDDYTFKSGKSYIISGFVYRNDNPIAISDTRDLCIYVYDTKTDANGATIPDNCLTKMEFDDTLGEEWQQRKTIFTTKKETTSLIVYLSYNNMMYSCDFDNIELYEATTKNAIDAVNIVPSTDVDYDYSENNSILEEIKTTVDGDELGTFYNYTDDENYISKVTNNSIATYYDYDENSGLLLSKGKNSDSSKNAQYSYTAVGLLEYVNQVTTQIDGSTVNINTTYSYENDRIKTIEHNGFIYKYSYDANGRVTGISEYQSESTQESQLVAYEYNNDNINKITYGNGAKILYEYNQFGYITKITYTPAPITRISEDGVEETIIPESTIYEYTYDNYGNVLSYTDNANNTITTIDESEGNDNNSYSYSYKIKEQGDDGSVIYQHDINNSNIKTLFGVKTVMANPEVTSSSGVTTNVMTYRTYKNNNSTIASNLITATTKYDKVGRTFETIATDKTATVKNVSTFVNNGIRTSDLVNTYTSSVTKLSDASGEPRIHRKFTYSYNDRGQITDIYRASVNNVPENIEGTSSSVNSMQSELLKHYEYDEAGQVILDVNMDTYTAIKYKYNAGGNLVSKTVYENENATDKSAFYYKKSTGKFIFYDENAVTTTYNYSSAWSDVLTGINNHTVTYDEIGNPINYVGANLGGGEISGTMTWDGTRLTSFDDGNQKYLYKYSADGFRTQKIVCDSDNINDKLYQMDYIYENDTLVGYKTTSYTDFDSSTQTQNIANEIITNIVYNSTDEVVGIDAQVIAYEYTENTDETTGETTLEVTTNSERLYLYTLRDGQGNVTDLYSADEDLVIHFSYDAYGNCTLSFSGNTIASLKQQIEGTSNIWAKILMALLASLALAAMASGTMVATQQTYKGYVCDYETGLYYSQNRFYSPSWGRFINADDSNIMLQHQDEVFNANLFNYCDNDPVNNVDLSGYAPTSYDTADNILSALNVDQLNTVQVGVVPSKLKGKVANEMTIFGLSLATVKDTDDKKYWNRVFDTTENTVNKSNGNNYMDTVISQQSGAATMYDLKPSTSPYNIGE